MNFAFETLPLENKEIMQEQILALFARDIKDVFCEYDMYNYKFIFTEGCFPAVIRVEQEMIHNTMEDMLCELMWVDDLKNDIPNICQPLPSLTNRLVERIMVGETPYLVTMFRKANGSLLTGKQLDTSFFYNAGVMLGKIHRSSSNGYQNGFRYKRKHWDELPYYDFSCLEEHFAPHVHQKAQALLEKIKSIPRDPRWYGMIHGQFCHGSLFCDWGDLWAFNFDACCYGYFILDIAYIVNTCIQNQNYAAKFPNMTPRDRIFGEDGILTQLRAGYSSEYQLPDEQWDMIEDLFTLEVVMTLVVAIIYESFPDDIITLWVEKTLTYLRDDKSPIDLVDEVRQSFIASMTPEQERIVHAEIPWFD